MTRSRIAALFGLTASAWAFLVPAVASLAHPSYSHTAQFISELGASGAANGCLVSWGGFAPTGFLLLGFLVLASSAFDGSRLATAGLASLGAVGAGYVASAVFPCDPGCPAAGSVAQSIHNLFGFLEYLGALSGLLLLAVALRGKAAWRHLSAASGLSAALVAVGFVAMLLPALESVRGVSQRVAEPSIFAWVAYASVLLLGHQRVLRG